MNHLISIVIPVYNSEQYLSKCLDSIINQTYKNLEIIIVNDGSTDNSLNILKEYQEKDYRIKVISIENHGVSHARNIGIKNTTGEYISFVDSDDILENDAIELMYKDIIENNADLVQCNNYFDDQKIFYTVKNTLLNNKKEVFNNFLIEDICCTVWGKLYKRDLFNYVAFDEKYNNHEDELFMYDIIKHCNVVYLDEKHLYHYSWNKDGSLTNKDTNNKDIELFISLFNNIIEYTKENYPDLLDNTQNFIIRKLKFLKEIKKDISINDFDLDNINIDVKNIIIYFFN